MSAQERIDEYWTWRAPSYDDDQLRVDHARPLWRDVWSRALPSPVDVLDVGTGSGYVAHLLAGLGHRVTGVDRSVGMLQRARSRGAAVEFVRGDAVDPPFRAGRFDAVVSRYVVWTLRDPVAAVRNWRRVLRPGGRLVVVDGAWFPDGLGRGGGPEFAAAYAGVDLPLVSGSPRALRDLLAAGGFTGIRSEPLTDLFEHDRRHGVSPGHRPTLQHLTTAVAPPGP
ncbi:class I SAM-dependent methyltransferase [Kineococcus sp. SYSU DK001]|uniref:class I SAM-dependent methyltransferase n=1 Tax=Kineococcus sp. SYSU DK001 TaxID=3383122 RepID=UPI003D7EC2B4